MFPTIIMGFEGFFTSIVGYIGRQYHSQRLYGESIKLIKRI